MTSRSTGRAGAAAVLAVTALLLAGLFSPAVAAASTAKVKGVVTQDGKAVPFAKVQIYRLVFIKSDGEYEVATSRLKTDNTDSRGRYSFSGLAVKTATSSKYVIVVTDRKGKSVKTYRTVVARRGKAITKNVRLRPAATLTGTVTTSDGRSPAGLTVAVDPGSYNDLGQSYEKLYPEWSTPVKADGTFTLSGIPSGRTYDEVLVSDGPSATQCYDFVAGTLAECATGNDQAGYARQRISLASGEQRTLPAVAASKFAPPVATLSGKVTDTAGKPLKGIAVTVSSGTSGATKATRSTGRYTINESLAAGSYTIRFDDPKHIWATQYLGGAVKRPVAITPGQPVSGLDVALKSISTAKIASKTGTGSAKVAFQIKRKASGGAPSGILTLSFEGRSKTASVKKGKATVTLGRLPKGSLRLVATYSGTSSTAGFSKIVKVNVT